MLDFTVSIQELSYGRIDPLIDGHRGVFLHTNAQIVFDDGFYATQFIQFLHTYLAAIIGVSKKNGDLVYRIRWLDRWLHSIKDICSI